MRHVVLSGAIARVNHAARAGRDNLGTITAALLLGLASLACALLVSYRINRHLSRWILPPLMIRAFGARCQFRTRAVQQRAPYSITSSGGRHLPDGMP